MQTYELWQSEVWVGKWKFDMIAYPDREGLTKKMLNIVHRANNGLFVHVEATSPVKGFEQAFNLIQKELR